MDLKSLLNKEQYEAATTIEGQVLILAGAGSGKTRVLTHRIAHMIEDLYIKPYNILAITFTNKAAAEMKERVKALIGNEAEYMWISTFHSSCVRILRREIEKLGYKKDFTIYDSSDQKTLIKHVMKELNINEKDITDMEILGAISKAKDNLQSAESFKREFEGDFRKSKIADAYLLYQKKLRQNNALDFDDLIVKTVELFKKNPDVLEFYQNKFKYIMIDEYQDTNKAQYEFAKLLANKYKNICVVGDDDQCIYAWRGADIRNILDFEKDYPEAKVVKLEQNYRSKGNILEAANKVIKNNAERKQKVLRTDQILGEKISIYRAYSDKMEATFIVEEIKKIMQEKNLNYSDFAILYRTNAQSRNFEEGFRRATIPYRIFGGLKFYDRKEIKDILSYLKVIVNPQDAISLRRIINVPKRSIGDTTMEKVQLYANEVEDTLYNSLLDIDTVPGLTSRSINPIKKFTDMMDDLMIMSEQLKVSEFIEYVLEKSGYLQALKDSKLLEDESRIENLKELVSDAVEFEKSNEEDKSLSTYLEKVALIQDMDSMGEEDNYVMLMTVHSSKGLEFPVVFMVGMENGIFPNNICFDKTSQMEEARRLCYVGITRAREKLYMTSAETRMVFGKTVAYPQSDFISEVPSDLKEYINKPKVNNANSVTTTSKGINSRYNNPHSLRGNMTYGRSNMTTSQANKRLDDILGLSDETSKKCTVTEAKIGRKVKHSKFGVGTIITATKVENDVKLTIAFDSQGVKNLMLSFAPLELL
ncbi:DNA helicase PcrA [Clostridium tarantellae]|uniref:ATP-dependent DNA helicase n=1 Tax=Clostridium tarantellae TaxID=39493 RepID=A0A6I1MM95_9CLOT|nr:DNA helicase PcrA [Clostridium tarantellae]MPQ43362.1 DNA helicase PcrA [Clostridium tarantellae]